MVVGGGGASAGDAPVIPEGAKGQAVAYQTRGNTTMLKVSLAWAGAYCRGCWGSSELEAASGLLGR